MPTGYKLMLREFTTEERQVLAQFARSQSSPALVVGWAKVLLAVAEGATFTAAARAAGRKDRNAVAHLVQRFNAVGLGALVPRPKGHPPIQYGPAEAERILAEVTRPPDVDQDGTATWSLSLLKRTLRAAADGLPQVSTWTIFQVLHEAGYSWQKTRTWCKTGIVLRKRGENLVEVTDPAAERKKG